MDVRGLILQPETEPADGPLADWAHRRAIHLEPVPVDRCDSPARAPRQPRVRGRARR